MTAFRKQHLRYDLALTLRAMSDSEIDSDIVGSDVSFGGEYDSQSESPNQETAEERRVRMAKAALRTLAAEVGVDAVAGRLQGEVSGLTNEGTLLLSSQIQSAFERDQTCFRPCFIKSQHRSILSIGIDSIGQIVVLSTATGVVEGWDTTGEPRQIFSLRMRPNLRRGEIHPQSAGKTRALNRGTAVGCHYGSVTAVAVSDDGQYLVTGGQDGFVLLWSLTQVMQAIRAQEKTTVQPVLLESFAAHSPGKFGVTAVSFPPHSNYFFTTGEDKRIHTFSAEDRGFLMTLYGPALLPTALDAVSEQQLIVTGSDRRAYVVMTELAKRLEFSQVRSEGPFIDGGAGLNDQYFVTGGWNGGVSLWSTRSRNPLSTQYLWQMADEDEETAEEAVPAGMGSAIMSADVKLIQVGEVRGKAKDLRKQRMEDDEEPMDAAEKPDEEALNRLAGSKAAAGREIPPEDWVTSLATIKNSDLAISGSAAFGIVFWQIDPEAKAPGDRLVPVATADVPGFVNKIAIAPAGRVVAVAIGRDYRFGRWPRRDGVKSRDGFLLLRLPISESAAARTELTGRVKRDGWRKTTVVVNETETVEQPGSQASEGDMEIFGNFGLGVTAEEAEQSSDEQDQDEPARQKHARPEAKDKQPLRRRETAKAKSGRKQKEKLSFAW